MTSLHHLHDVDNLFEKSYFNDEERKQEVSNKAKEAPYSVFSMQMGKVGEASIQIKVWQHKVTEFIQTVSGISSSVLQNGQEGSKLGNDRLDEINELISNSSGDKTIHINDVELKISRS